MCTLILLYRLLKDYPVLVLHNRYMGRDAMEEPPRKQGNIIYPMDVSSGGTWIGFNSRSLLFAVTNQETQTLDKPGRSRGLLAMDILMSCDTADEAKDILLDPANRNPYRTGNFAAVDARRAYHIVWDNGTHLFSVKPGVYVISTVTPVPEMVWSDRSRRIYDSSEKRVKRAYQLLDGYRPGGIDEAICKLMTVSADHYHGRSESSICFHHPEHRQTSSTIMALGENPRVLYCPGNHCENPYTDYSQTIR